MSLRPAASTIEIGPTLSPTAIDESSLPDERLKEMIDPPVTEDTNPTLPLDEMSGCACSSSMALAGSERLRVSPSRAR
jgi:hypothetical protein